MLFFRIAHIRRPSASNCAKTDLARQSRSQVASRTVAAYEAVDRASGRIVTGNLVVLEYCVAVILPSRFILRKRHTTAASRPSGKSLFVSPDPESIPNELAAPRQFIAPPTSQRKQLETQAADWSSMSHSAGPKAGYGTSEVSTTFFRGGRGRRQPDEQC